MAGLTCVYCQTENDPGDQLCQACFRRMPTDPPLPPPAKPSADPDTAETDPRPPAAGNSSPAAAPAHCPHCDAEVPDPGNQVCVECHQPLTHPRALRICFPQGEVTVAASTTVRLGRDPANSPVAALFAARGNVSRLHATVGVDDDGAWVRDERSLNGTFVNEVQVPPGTRIALDDGATLRLAADVTATVRRADP